MAALWEEEKKALLPLPSVPFEPVHLESARVNKYGRIQYRGENYDLPRAEVEEVVLLKLFWDRVEIFGHSQELLAKLPRPYTLRAKPIDWRGHFDLFVRKPRGARHAPMWRHLPAPVKEYLENEELYRERLTFIHALLSEGFSMELIACALAEPIDADPGVIRHVLYRLAWPDRPLEAINETYTPPSVKSYDPKVGIYDRLVPVRKGGENRGIEGTM